MSTPARAPGGKREPGGTKAPVRLDASQIGRGLAAAAAGWLLPGLGHWVVGARGKALVFFAIVTATITTGFALGGNLSVVDPRTPVISRLQVATNLALGPVEPVMRAVLYGSLAYRGDESFVPGPQRRALELRRARALGRPFSAFGTTYLLTAGLLNILLLLDAWDIAIGRKSRD
ncbi:MAG: hypothetical protein MUF27_01490 [Acidobacteria bacterium]|nr:hypothetical protein [Acidobacteriota bacterium]